MKLAGNRHIDAERTRVWDALNDPETLKRCIDGCQSLERREDGSLAAVVRAKVGPVNAPFSGTLEVADADPPNSYRLTGQGKGGAAGFAKGEALVRLEDAGGQTLVHYDVTSSLGGKLAQLGNRLIDSAARKYAETFFARLEDELTGAPAQAATPAPEPAADPQTPQTAQAPQAPQGGRPGLPMGVWVAALVLAILGLLALLWT